MVPRETVLTKIKFIPAILIPLKCTQSCLCFHFSSTRLKFSFDCVVLFQSSLHKTFILRTANKKKKIPSHYLFLKWLRTEEKQWNKRGCGFSILRTAWKKLMLLTFSSYFSWLWLTKVGLSPKKSFLPLIETHDPFT